MIKAHKFTLTRSLSRNYERSEITVEYEILDNSSLKESVMQASKDLYKLLVTQSVCSNLLTGVDGKSLVQQSDSRHQSYLNKWMEEAILSAQDSEGVSGAIDTSETKENTKEAQNGHKKDLSNEL